eukprot:612507-Rhodomonas_salina.1
MMLSLERCPVLTWRSACARAYWPTLWCYTPATRCPVLRYNMVLQTKFKSKQEAYHKKLQVGIVSYALPMPCPVLPTPA